MALTRAEVETILVRRCGRLLTAASMDGATVNGTNADLNDPIGYAVRQCGGVVASIANVSDADLSAVAIDDQDKLLDIAELRTLENIWGNLGDVDYTIGPRSERMSQLPQRVQQRLNEKRAQVADAYDVSGNTLETGVITNPFAEHSRE